MSDNIKQLIVDDVVTSFENWWDYCSTSPEKREIQQYLDGIVPVQALYCPKFPIWIDLLYKGVTMQIYSHWGFDAQYLQRIVLDYLTVDLDEDVDPYDIIDDKFIFKTLLRMYKPSIITALQPWRLVQYVNYQMCDYDKEQLEYRFDPDGEYPCTNTPNLIKIQALVRGRNLRWRHPNCWKEHL